jgi:radical SAM-linked protein
MTFTKQGWLRYVGHLDMAKAWERILRRAELPVAYSQGFHPQPKLQFASALPVGCASTAEVADVALSQSLTPEAVLQALAPQLPDGLQVLSIVPVSLDAPALQAALQSAEYRLSIETSEPPEVLGQRVQDLLKAASLPRQRRGKSYDLRPLILDLRLLEASVGHVTLWAHLRASQSGGTGRPDEVLDALGLAGVPADVCRTSLCFNP